MDLLELDLKSAVRLPNLACLHAFIDALTYQDACAFVQSLNWGLLHFISASKYVRTCLWMAMQVHSRHGFLIEIGCLDFVAIDKALKNDWMWIGMKRACAFLFVDDEYKESIVRIKQEVRKIRNRWSKVLDTSDYDSLMQQIARMD